MIKLTRGCVFNPVFAFQIRDGWWRLQDKNGNSISISSDEIETLAALVRADESRLTPLQADAARPGEAEQQELPAAQLKHGS